MIDAVRGKLSELLAEEAEGCGAAIAPAGWNQTFGKLAFQGPEYAEPVIAYHDQYVSEKAEAFVPMPLILTIQAKPVGLWPLHASCSGGEWSIGSNSRGILEPAVIGGLGRNEKKRLYRWCLRFLLAMGSFVGAKRLRFEAEEAAGDLESWYWILLNSVEARVEAKHHLFVDLSLPIDAIRTSIRKSYRPLVSKAEKLWRASILEEVGEGDIEELRRFHIGVAGRETRSRETWLRQRDFVNAGNGFMITVRAEGGVLVGGALFSGARDACSYDVGVYDRALFDMPIGHLIQMRAIEFAKSKGMSLYHVGQRPFPGSDPAVTEKEIHIGLFKQGFATRFGHRMHVIAQVGKAA